ncbi:class I adenylate-forming enzyme family protein [Haloarchaeobius sp. DFWS5]|uniref:class I adenylate-forming enzyme family protein n=1 Tax=Haloarchaeobius sp. DFWS5 TaxID=3446114 RepID=UPI003EBE0FBF
MDANFELGVQNHDSFVDASRNFTVGDLVRKSARMYGDDVAVKTKDEEITYDELNDRVNRLANGLLEMGVTPNETTIAMLAENRAEIIVLYYASAKLGTLTAALNWRIEKTELTHCIDLVEADYIMASDRFEEKRRWATDDSDAQPEYLAFDDTDESDDTVSYQKLLEMGDTSEPLEPGSVDPEQGLVVLYTSGTTGMPKGAVISHRAWMARAYKTITDFELNKGSSEFAWSPMCHIVTADWLPTTAILGGTFYPIDGFDPERIVEILKEDGEAISWFVLLPGTISTFFDYMEESGTSVDEFREIRHIGGLVDLVDPKKVKRVTERFDMPFINSYGSTEIGHGTSGGHHIQPGVHPKTEDLSKIESTWTDAKLIDESWNEVDEGDVGELAVRGPALCSGYINNPEANESDFNDGWFRTGDMFERRDDGMLDFINRRKYLIKSGGENIYPAEIEDILLENELVEDAIAVRVDDEKWGEVPRVIVSSTQPDELDKDELMAMLEDRIANYKLPNYLEIVSPEDLPRSTTGKIVREDVESWEVSEDSRVRQV